MNSRIAPSCNVVRAALASWRCIRSLMAAPSTSKIDAYGFERPDDFDYETYEEFIAKYLSVLVRRARKWQDLIGKNKTVTRNFKVKRYVRKGIPTEHRGMMWATVSGALVQKDANPGLYDRLLAKEPDEELVSTIRVDIPRTYPDNIHFQKTGDGQLKPLFNVLIAFAQHNTNIGYCQGLNYIAGLLLLVVKDEEVTFWLLTTLVKSILPDYYTKDMVGLLIDIDVLAELVKLKIPAIHTHVMESGITWPLLVTKWFICLYAEVLPIETVLRVWDCLFYEGSKILFRVALTLFKRNQQKILETPDFPQLLECFKEIVNDPIVLDCHEFMEGIFTEPGSLPKSQIEKLRLQCASKIGEQE